MPKRNERMTNQDLWFLQQSFLGTGHWALHKGGVVFHYIDVETPWSF